VRPWIAVSALIAVAAAAPQQVRTVLACAAGIALEALPYLAASTVLATLVGTRSRAFAAFLGCGCGNGAAARSLPAAAVTAALFGAPVALARVAAASLIAWKRTHKEHEDHADGVLAGIQRLALPALLAGAIAAFVPATLLTALPKAAAFCAGALLGVVASPCVFGGVALAASLRAHAPWACAGVLCTAGMFDLRALHRYISFKEGRAAYAFLAAACALVAIRHGAMLVHPRMTIPLAATAVFCAVLVLRRSPERSRAALAASCALLAAVVIGAPVPEYTASETTLADAFAGERVRFTGVALTQGNRTALVRYAITCCRADAQPVALLLDRRVDAGQWITASGTLVSTAGSLRLHVARIARVTPPADPFVYR
jgi:hypothetical protein